MPEEKRKKVIKHIAKRNGYFMKTILCLIAVLIFFNLNINVDGVLSVLSIAMTFISIMAAFIFKMLHQGMLYCPLCGTAFGYASWMTSSMPSTCPNCGEVLHY